MLYLFFFFWLWQVNPSVLLVVSGSINATQFMNLTLAIILITTPTQKKKKHWIINELITN